MEPVSVAEYYQGATRPDEDADIYDDEVRYWEEEEDPDDMDAVDPYYVGHEPDEIGVIR